MVCFPRLACGTSDSDTSFECNSFTWSLNLIHSFPRIVDCSISLLSFLNSFPARKRSILTVVAANCISFFFRRFGQFNSSTRVEDFDFEWRLIETTGGKADGPSRSAEYPLTVLSFLSFGLLVFIKLAMVLLFFELPLSLLLPRLAQSPLPASNLELNDDTMVIKKVSTINNAVPA